MPLRLSLSSAPPPGPTSALNARRWWRPEARRSPNTPLFSAAPLQPSAPMVEARPAHGAASDEQAQDEQRYLQRLREAGL